MLARPRPTWLVAVFVLLSSIFLRWPAANYDELLYTNAALGSVDDSFVSARLLGKPVLLLPYIGALKAWIFRPIYAVFGFSIELTRLVTIGMAALAIWLIVRAVSARHNVAGWCVAGLLVTSPSLMELTRVDVGPNVIEFLLLALLLALLLRSEQRFGGRDCALVSLVFVVGTFNKLNFLWWVVTFVVIVAIARRLPAVRSRGMALLVLSFAACVGYVRFISQHFHLGEGFGPKTLFRNHAVLSLVHSVADGSWFRWLAYRNGRPPTSVMLAILWAATLVVCVGTVIARKQKNAFALVAGIAAAFAMISSVLEAQRGWHVLMLLPLCAVLVATVVMGESDGFSMTRILCGAVIAAQLLTSLWVVHARTDSGTVAYTHAIYQLADVTKPALGLVYLTDWGMKSYLQSADHTRAKYVETFWSGVASLQCSSLVVVRNDGEVMANAHAGAVTLVRDLPKIASVTDPDGAAIFLVYSTPTC